MIEIEVTEFVHLKILDDKVAQLRRAYDEDQYITDDTLHMIFGWEREKKETCSASTSPAIVHAPDLAAEAHSPDPIPSFVKKTAPANPTAPISDEKLAAIKHLHMEGKNGRQIAEALGISEGTVSKYKQKMGLIGVSSMTEISGPVPGGGRA